MIPDLQALTPEHVLRQGASSGPLVSDLPEAGDESAPVYRRRWKHAQYLAGQFWKRWLRVYVPSLRRLCGNIVPRRNLQDGDLVIVTDELFPRRSWKVGRIIETPIGADGLVRHAIVKTMTGSLKRPVNKICLLEPQA